MKHETLRFPKKRVYSAGRNVSNGTNTDADLEVIENFRAAHSRLINSFQSNIRRHNRSMGKKVLHATRLKRMPTILDKLVRQPKMDLRRLQDIAGLRVIYENEERLKNSRLKILSSKWKHNLLTEDNRFDYIEKPKESGYRGIHDVYSYKSSNENNASSNGLKIEIQYRTLIQHYWATAVEVFDHIHIDRVKFGEGEVLIKRHFMLTSEILARAFENRFSCLPNSSDAQILEEYFDIESTVGILDGLKRVRTIPVLNPGDNIYRLLLVQPTNGKHDIEVKNFTKLEEALAAYGKAEREMPSSSNVVLVRGSGKEIQSAYQNYFSNTEKFKQLVQKGTELLKK